MKIADRVLNILKFSRDARNSDKELWIIYAQKSGVNLSPAQIDVIKQMPSFETLRRTRQLIQGDRPDYIGRYKADDKVIEERFTKFKDMRGGYSPERVLEDRVGNKFNLPKGW